MKILGIYPEGIKKTEVESGWERPLKIKAQKCYFDYYKINDKYYWYYDEERVYHIEDKTKEAIIFVVTARCPDEAIKEFVNWKMTGCNEPICYLKN